MNAELSVDHQPSKTREPVVLSSHDRAVYASMSATGVWWDVPGHWTSLRGEKAIDALNGLITNDVTALADGEMQYAAALSAKGKLVSDMIVVRRDSATLLINVPDVAAASWLSLVRKYINPRLAKIADESASVRAFFVSEGLHPARLILSDVADASLRIEQFDNERRAHASPALVELLRVEAGLPSMGVDMDENTIPQEANLDTLNAISFTKGCYTGQETVARIHFRGHVNRHLRGLVSARPLAIGASVIDAAGKVVGDVRSSAVSPKFGAIALAMVRREVAPGAAVTIEDSHGSTTAQLVLLPFTNPSE